MGRQIFIFTASNEAAQAHLRDSIQNRIPIELAFKSFPSRDHDALRALDRSHGLYAWGAVPGRLNAPRWSAMNVGDWSLCVFNSRFRYVARVAAKFNNKQFAERLWRTNAKGETWQLMYFLERPAEVNICVRDLSYFLGSGFMGFTRIREEKISRIAAEFGDVDRFIHARLLPNADHPTRNNLNEH